MASRASTYPATFSFGRLIAVLAIGLWMLAVELPSISRLWSPAGTFGYSTDSDGRVIDVVAARPAAFAGLRTDDHFDLRAVPFSSLRYAIGPLTLSASPGVSISLPVKTDGGDRWIRMTSVTFSARPSGCTPSPTNHTTAMTTVGQPSGPSGLSSTPSRTTHMF
jgi:hypothetical protein